MGYKKLFGLLMMIAFLLVIGACASDEDGQNESNNGNKENGELAYNPPLMDDLDPDDPKTAYIEYGEEVFNETNTVLPDNVGNKLSCMSCHADGGLSKSSSMVGVTT